MDKRKGQMGCMEGSWVNLTRGIMIMDFILVEV